MRSSDIYMLLSKKYKLDNKLVRDLINDYFDFVVEGMLKDGKFTRSKFGSFRVYKTKNRVIYNVHTGEKYIVPGMKIVSFRPSLYLKSVINGHCEKAKDNGKTDVLEDND
ncbi:MAG: HU family DNA-binding protein [Sulfurihydrogenibium azorense]|uniref:HU family DNA-binding protein n=1 Tax=Sulfurihydrogenibium azorense TaxID=309806 RepID=UPI00391DF8EA